MTKYCSSSSYGYNGYTDININTVLDPEGDAATSNWGGSWRMPTKAELQELLNTANCTWTWYASDNTEYNGIAGYKVTSKKSGYADRSIFLPASGYCWYPDLCNVGFEGYYWSSSLSTDNPYFAYYLEFTNNTCNGHDGGIFDRTFGFPVRPVCP